MAFTAWSLQTSWIAVALISLVLMVPFGAALIEPRRRSIARLAQEAPAELKKSLELSYKYAVQHRDIIARFGRFPHRNAILGRPSTAEELEFLKQPGSSF